MSSVKDPIVLDRTVQTIADQMKLQNEILTAMASGTYYKPKTIGEILDVIAAGKASSVFQIGDQLVTNWTDITTGVSYECPLNIIAFPTATLQDGEEVPAMRIQWQYATPFGVQFNNCQAFYYCEQALPAGTYNVEIGTTWGSYCVQGTTYQFTLTKEVPKGGQLVGFRNAPFNAPTKWDVCTYSSKTATDALETVPVIEGAGGTNIGTLKTGGDGKINCLQRVAFGYARWGQSALEQWLNSDAGVGEWWTPQNDYDRCPDQLTTKAGFLTGFDDEFRAALTPVKVATALNKVTDAVESDADPLEVTYDKFFPLSLEQTNIKPELDGEGEACEYWMRASQMSTKMSLEKTYPQIIAYAIENHTIARDITLRSASIRHSHHTWSVTVKGTISKNLASDAAYIVRRCLPACDLCVALNR
jgi:hypothetical protein